MENGSHASGDLKDEVRRERVRLAYGQLPVMQSSSFVVALILGYTVRGQISHPLIFVWLALIFVIATGRFIFYVNFLKVRNGPFNGKFWENAYLAQSLASGIFWGLSAFLIFPKGNPEIIALHVLVVASLSASTTVSHSSIKLGPAAWVVPVMLSYAAACFADGGEFGRILAALILLYTATVLSYSFRTHETIASAIALRFENIELLEKLRLTTKLKDQFLSIVSHDFKSPLASIQGWLSFLHELPPRELTDMRDKGTIKDLADSAQGMLDMMEQLLKHRMLKQGRFELKKRFVDVRALAEKRTAILKYLASNKRLAIRNNLPADMRILADPDLFGQVLINLLSNAIKFTPAGGEITVFAPRPGEPVIAVKDTGIGIGDDLLPGLFRGGPEVSSRGTAGEEGTGLGLRYSSEIMRAHGGSLSVESGEGEGAVFYAAFPAFRAVVMLVDDREVQRAIMARALKNMGGIETIEAENGVEALQVMDEIRPDILITDIQMPEMDGVELLKSMKGNPAYSSLPVIVLSAVGGPGKGRGELRQTMLALGAKEFLDKPVVEEELRAAVHRLLP